MFIRSLAATLFTAFVALAANAPPLYAPVSYKHFPAHETVLELVCRLLLEKKKKKTEKKIQNTKN